MADARSSQSGAAGRLSALRAMVRLSPIWPWPPVRARRPAAPRLPAGYDEVDVRVLEWIASQRRAMLG